MYEWAERCIKLQSFQSTVYTRIVLDYFSEGLLQPWRLDDYGVGFELLAGVVGFLKASNEGMLRCFLIFSSFRNVVWLPIQPRPFLINCLGVIGIGF